MSCEHCWIVAQVRGEEYSAVIARAEREGWICTSNTPEGARARAGQFWDEAKQCDRRTVVAEPQATPDPAVAVLSQPSKESEE